MQHRKRFLLLKWWKFDHYQLVCCQILLLFGVTILPLLNFARSPERVRNPHLRAKLAETLEALVPIQRSENSSGLLSGSQINMVFIMFIKEINVLRFGYFIYLCIHSLCTLVSQYPMSPCKYFLWCLHRCVHIKLFKGKWHCWRYHGGIKSWLILGVKTCQTHRWRKTKKTK